MPAFTLDGGNLLFKLDTIPPGLQQQAEITAEGIIDAYSLMHYDAVAIGRHDLAAGLSFLTDQITRSKFTWLSANLVHRSDEKPVFSASLVRRIGTLTVGIIGLTGNDPTIRFAKNEDAVILPWQKVLPELVGNLAVQCDLVILLSNYPPDQNQKIAETFSDIHIIIQSTPRGGNSPPRIYNKSLMLQTGKQGKYLGWMLINWQKSKVWGREGATQELATKKQELDGLNGRISRIERREKEEDLPADVSYQNLLTARKKLLSEIMFLENELYNLRDSGRAPATFENSFIALEANMADQPDVEKIVEATKQRVNQAGRSVADMSAASVPPPELQLEELVFTGWQACVACHKTQVEFWQTTAHFSAYQTLVEQDQHFNLDCLPCHVTATYKDVKISDNNAVLLPLPLELRQVGCEACHGPGRRHVTSQAPADISRKVDRVVCIRCHTTERDPEFNYANDLERIACPASKE